MASIIELLGGGGGYSSGSSAAAAMSAASAGEAGTLAVVTTHVLQTAVVAAAKLRRYVQEAEQRGDRLAALQQHLQASNPALLSQLRSGPGMSNVFAYAAGVGTAAAVYRFRGAPIALRNKWFSSRKHSQYGHAARHDVVLHRKGYAVGYRYDLKAPTWASMIVCGHSTSAADKRTTNPFMVDPSVDASKQVAPDKYTGTGWDRGHVAPRAAVAFSAEASDESFYMTNIVPQDPVLNRGAWSRLERQVRRWSAVHGPLAIVVGPTFNNHHAAASSNAAAAVAARLWGMLMPFSSTTNATAAVPRPPLRRRLGDCGESDVAIPDGFFMAITCVRRPSKSVAFYFDNTAAAAEAAREQCLVGDLAISLDALEAATATAGVSVFRHVPLHKRPLPWHRKTVDREFWARGAIGFGAAAENGTTTSEVSSLASASWLRRFARSVSRRAKRLARFKAGAAAPRKRGGTSSAAASS